MRPMVPPTVTPADLIAACINGVTDTATAQRINSATAALIAASNNYHSVAAMSALHTIPRVQTIGLASASDIQNLYKYQMSAAKGSARSHYNAIKSAAVNTKCPLCGVGTVRTLDHHLPKSHYPDLSICPHNLVPACDYCQAGKLAKYPSNAGEQTLHPYYDDFTSEQWIWGTLVLVGNPVVVFSSVPPVVWPETNQQRATRHFDVFKLGVVYTSNANDDLSTMRSHLIRLGAAGGPQAVHAYLDDERSRWSSRLNSWQHVMYQTLVSSHAFVSGAYTLIPT